VRKADKTLDTAITAISHDYIVVDLSDL